MNVERKNGKLHITIDENAEPQPSASGKSLIVASTRGNVPTPINVEGQPLIVSVNAYVKA